MHYTLHLTNQCNMACDYCYVDGKKPETMSLETAQKAIDLASRSDGGSVGIIFFGGEPLLEKKLIYNIVQYCRAIEKPDRCLYHFKVTTNGLLLNQEFMEFSQTNGVLIALSKDGVMKAHNLHRKIKSGEGTFDKLSSAIDLLLAFQPYAPVLMTVNPDTVQYYAESVRYLYKRGFKYIVCSMNYAGKWDDASLKVLEEQYLQLADFYFEKTVQEEKFYLSPFEVKISSHINRNSYCTERCELGKKQISVGPDGTLYPCVQFVGDGSFAIGHVDTGIDEIKRNRIYEMNEEEKEECRQCAVKNRCNHYCGCMNRQATGSIRKVSPVLCAHERILLPIADSLAERLFRKRSAMFLQKHYNDMYPLVSLLEDKLSNDEGR